jgi:alpha-ketoglutarate-dependent taurine dioxygenase
MSPSSVASPRGVDRGSGKPTLLRVQAAGDPLACVIEHREMLRTAVVVHGALLVRGLGLRDADQIGAVFRELGTLMADAEPLVARQAYAEGVYTSSKWLPGQSRCMHHELSYRLEFPGLMLFACLTAPDAGGATAVADAPSVLRALPEELVGRFERDGWLLIRNYGEGAGTTVANAFGTDDRRAIESYCRANAIEFEWQPGGGLRTRQRRSAVVRHPLTAQRCWFNQIAFLNEWTLEPELRDYLVEVNGEDGLPFNTRFGNGDPIDRDIVELIKSVYDAHTVREPWEPGDLMLVDNLRAAHNTEPFVGIREVLVGVANPVRLTDCSPTIELTP